MSKAHEHRVLLPYQKELWRWEDDAFERRGPPVMVVLKSRRVGFSWGVGGLLCEVSASAPPYGRDCYVISANEDLAREFMRDAAEWARGMDEVIDDVVESDTTLRIKFTSGHVLQCMTSSSINFRGKGGLVVIDEAAHHADLDAVLGAALPLTAEPGGHVLIMSTPFGVEGIGGPFWKLVEDCREGRSPHAYMEVSFDEALAQGYYRYVIAPKEGVAWTQEREDAYRLRVRATLGEYAAQELDCTPARAGGAYIPRDLVMRCVHEVPIVRLRSPKWPPGSRQLAAWFEATIAPLLRKMDPSAPSYYGLDFGRFGDASSFVPGQVIDDVRVVPWVLEMHDVDTEVQAEIVQRCVNGMPNFRRGVMDAGGAGSGLADILTRRHALVRAVFVGGKANPTGASGSTSLRWAELLPAFKRALEAEEMALPSDPDAVGDFSVFTTSAEGLPTTKKARTRGRAGQRHGDTAVASVLLWEAARFTGALWAASPSSVIRAQRAAAGPPHPPGCDCQKCAKFERMRAHRKHGRWAGL